MILRSGLAWRTPPEGNGAGANSACAAPEWTATEPTNPTSRRWKSRVGEETVHLAATGDAAL